MLDLIDLFGASKKPQQMSRALNLGCGPDASTLNISLCSLTELRGTGLVNNKGESRKQRATARFDLLKGFQVEVEVMDLLGDPPLLWENTSENKNPNLDYVADRLKRQ